MKKLLILWGVIPVLLSLAPPSDPPSSIQNVYFKPYFSMDFGSQLIQEMSSANHSSMIFEPMPYYNMFNINNSVDTDLDLQKILDGTIYGYNKRGGSKFYLMMGSGGANCYCMDRNDFLGAFYTSSKKELVMQRNVLAGSYVWVQFMSQCHGNTSSSNLNGRGFWYKKEKYYGANDYPTAEGDPDAKLEMVPQTITYCTDSYTIDYGCNLQEWGNLTIVPGCN
jgi:hypothetical protein